MEIGQVPAYKRWSNRYSYAFKMEVIEAFQSGQMSQRQVTRSMVFTVLRLLPGRKNMVILRKTT